MFDILRGDQGALFTAVRLDLLCRVCNINGTFGPWAEVQVAYGSLVTWIEVNVFLLKGLETGENDGEVVVAHGYSGEAEESGAVTGRDPLVVAVLVLQRNGGFG